MLSVDAALNLLLARATPVTETETISSLAANRRVLAVDQASHIDVPPLDNSAMDGYALRAGDCGTAPVVLPISQRIPAGTVPAPLTAGTAARIFTGAPVPPGADAVVMQERCQVRDDGATVEIQESPKAGANIRRAGEDIRQGATILRAGTRLRAQELGLAASVGLASLPVFRKLRVAMFFTGNELTMPGDPLRPGAIYNSNRHLLQGLLENVNCDITDYGNVPDTLEATRAALRDAAANHDLIITSGGASVGEEDHIKPALQAEGRLDMWQIAIKPGKPLAFGEVARANSTSPAFFLGLPGNPVASFVTFLLFARPFILRMQGVANLTSVSYPMRADFDWPRADKRNEFLRVRINADGGLELFNNQGSGVLSSTVWGDGLVDNPPGNTIARGDLVRFLPFAHLDVM